MPYVKRQATCFQWAYWLHFCWSGYHFRWYLGFMFELSIKQIFNGLKYNLASKLCVCITWSCMWYCFFQSFQAKCRNISWKKSLMEYILNYAAISYFGISPGIFGALFEFNIFDELDFWIDWDFMRENSRERKLFQGADYMSKLVSLDRDKKCPDKNVHCVIRWSFLSPEKVKKLWRIIILNMWLTKVK